MTTKYFLIILIFLFASCEPGSTFFYEVDNQTDKNITIEHYFIFDSNIKTIIILPSKTNQILFDEHPLGLSSSFDRQDSVYLGYRKIKIRVDTSYLNINFMDKKNWTYRKTSDGEGWCTLTIK